MAEVEWIEEGSKAPAFSLKDQSGKTVKLSDFKGQAVV
ncbi:MAG: redoxin domain-containing protein, partial [Pirellulaceae bacterium]|nr:redoxin domain-containing protein [Pirellulaceae bacterium]